MGFYPKGVKGKCDKLFSEIIRSRGACENCGRSQGVQLQTAHIISRRYTNTRVNPDNAFCLCASCHRYYTDFPKEFSRFITDKLGIDKYEQVKNKALSTGKVDWEAEYKTLQAIKKSIVLD